MRKVLLFYMLLITSLTTGILVSCNSDDDGGGGVSGCYASWDSVCRDGKTKVYHVIRILGSNSLEYYTGVAEGNADNFTVPFPGKSGWYYNPNSPMETLIYSIKGNQLFVTGRGYVYIIGDNGKTLTNEGTVFTKID